MMPQSGKCVLMLELKQVVARGCVSGYHVSGYYNLKSDVDVLQQRRIQPSGMTLKGSEVAPHIP